MFCYEDLWLTEYNVTLEYLIIHRQNCIFKAIYIVFQDDNNMPYLRPAPGENPGNYENYINAVFVHVSLIFGRLIYTDIVDLT